MVPILWNPTSPTTFIFWQYTASSCAAFDKAAEDQSPRRFGSRYNAESTPVFRVGGGIPNNSSPNGETSAWSSYLWIRATESGKKWSSMNDSLLRIHKYWGRGHSHSQQDCEWSVPFTFIHFFFCTFESKS